MNGLVSVIVPIYQCEKHLAKCIESILEQTYTNLEILLIDDGSTDRSGDICEQYSKLDSRIQVIHQKNQGAGMARNTGIDCCKGEYILFVDSDDYIDANTVTILLKSLGGEADVSICGHYRVYPDRMEKWGPTKYEILSGKETVIRFFAGAGSTYLGPVCCKLFKTDLFNIPSKIRFPAEMKYEDEFISYQLLYRAGTVSFISDIFYYCAVREESMMHRPLVASDLMIRARCLLAYYQWVDTVAPDMRSLIEYAAVRIFNGIVWSYAENAGTEEFKRLKPELLHLNQIVLKNTHNIRRNPYINNKAYKNYLLMKWGIIIPMKQFELFLKQRI